ncbi:MAG: hypothetical protein IJA82_04890 [Clostridia bacterium]|nr:hypothetical protein [Clostridia bacterium]
MNKKAKFIIQMDPYTGNLANIPVDKLIDWLFYCIDKKGVLVDEILWEGHCFFEQELPCYNAKIYKEFQSKGINIMERIIDECHKRGIKAYCNHRFSEVELESEGNEIKQKHKDWVIKTWWEEGLWNLASKDLQEFKLDYITRVMTKYPFDGICIDFLRHLPCLPVGKQWEYRECATEFMRKLRDNMNRLGRQVVVGAKLPEGEKACHTDGFDVEEWAKNNLVDFVIGGSRTINSDIEWYKKITQGTSTLVYTCWDAGHVSEGYHNQGSNFYRGMISNWLYKGTDGVVAFNFAPAPYEVLYKLLPPDEIMHCLGSDYIDFYNIFSEETLEDNERKFVAERRGGYPFLTGCGGNNVFAPLPAPIPSNEVLDIKIDACGDFENRGAEIRFVITNAKESCDKFKIFLNGTEIKDPSLDYSYKDQQIFWPDPQPSVYTANCLNSSPAPILEIKSKVDIGLIKNGTNTLSIAVFDGTSKDSISVERAEIIIGAKKP